MSEVRPHAGIVHPFRGTLGAARPDVLICAGLDPSGGAGLIADVRVVSDLGGRPVGVVTALTVQNTTAVIDTEAMGAAQIREQLEFLLSDVEVRAVKIGMIGSSEIARSISQALALSSAPVVWDPVIHPSRGDVRFVDSLFSHAVAALLPHVSLLTPNAHELGFLTGATIGNVADAVAVGSALAARISTAVLVKGGHLGGPDPKRISEGALKLAQNATPRSRESAAIVLPGQPPEESLEQPPEESLEQPPEESIDVLCRPGGGVELLRGWRVPGGHHVHGTGCALSSAIATYLALGAELVDACRAAKSFVTTRIRDPARPGRGSAAIV